MRARRGWRLNPLPWNPLHWNPRLSVALASLIFLAGADLLLKHPRAVPVALEQVSGPVLESTRSGLQLRTGPSSLTLLNHHGAVADQTVSAQGEISARYTTGKPGR